MPRWTKISLKITGILLGLILTLWMGVAAYIQFHKKELLQSITAQLNENLNGTLTIKSMEPALIRGFPGISVSLKDVLLRDSLWDKHHHDLLQAKDVSVAVDVFSIITGSPTIKNLSINDGKIYLFTDSNGYSNTNIFKKTVSQGKESGSRKKINRIYLNNVRVIIENKSRFKLFDFTVNHFLGKIKYNSTGWSAIVNIRTLVNSLAFNTQKGSFLKNKNFNTSLKLTFDNPKKLLSVPLQNVKIDNDKLQLGGNFSFAKNSSDFNLDVNVPDITLNNISSLLPQNIESILQEYKLEKSFAAQANIKGQLKGSGDPLIRVYMQVKDNTLTGRGETIENCYFNASFNNEVMAGQPRTDPNSAVSFYQMKGTWYDIPFKADSIKITNLQLPILAGKFIADFPLVKLNPITGSETFLFNTGTARLNLIYQAPFNPEDKSRHFINGTIQVKNAAVTYQPRNLSFKNVKVKLDFRGQDLFLEDMQVQSGNSLLQMEGSLKNFSNLYYTDPQKMLLDWNIKSHQLNLGEFLSFLGKRKSSINTASSSKQLNKTSRQLDRMLDQASVHIKLNVDRLIYRRFVAKNAIADIALKQPGISINNVSLNHAGGSLKLNGTIDQSGSLNQVNVNTTISNANIQQLFYAFNNFGQNTLTSQNLSGSFNAVTHVSGAITKNGELVSRSLHGTVGFNLRDGALINFEPMRKIGAFAFPNRNFSNITFKNLKNTLNIQGNYITIPTMQIESSVLNIFLGGVYGFSSGTNIAMQIPLRNPKNDEPILDKQEKEKRAKKGIIINLRAVDDGTGKVKFKLGKGKQN